MRDENVTRHGFSALLSATMINIMALLNINSITIARITFFVVIIY